ncbi:MAG: ATP-binding cassette domain-containing protein, partial [Glaciimonas sp.]|nr:ATP-binding cassette domain-containing protein [Glaciimonas sp.]
MNTSAKIVKLEPHQAPDSLLSIRNLKVSFRTDKKHTVDAVKGISFDIPRNSTIALVGESGSGKSVSSLAVMGLLSPDNAIVDPKGSIMFEGRDLLTLSIAERRKLCGKDISMIFQEPMTSLNPVFTVG